MKLLYAIAASLSIICFSASAQQIEYESALNMMIKNNPELRQSYENYRGKISNLNDYSLLSNPAIKYEREQISTGNGKDIEQVISVEQKIDLLFQPFIKSSVVSRESEALKLIYKRDSSKIVTDFEIQFNELILKKNIYDLYEATFVVVNKAYNAARDRYEEGNVSGFELKRFSGAKNTVLKDLSLSENNYREILEDILSKIYDKEDLYEFYSSEQQGIVLIGDLNSSSEVPTLSELQETAIKNRRDLRALRILKETGADRLTIENLNRMPGLTLEGGYKKINGLGEGFVLGLSLDVPLFNFNGNEIDKASVENNLINYELLKKEKNILLEAASLFNKLTSLRDQLIEFEKDKMEFSMLETANLLYSEGEISLVELLDAVNAYIEISKLYLTTKCDFKNSVAEAKKVLGIKLIGN